MTLGSQFSFSRVTGLGRMNSTASKFSFDADARLSQGDTMSIEASPSIEGRIRGGEEYFEGMDEIELHRKVSEWIGRELSQKKQRPEFGRRVTEPIFQGGREMVECG